MPGVSKQGDANSKPAGLGQKVQYKALLAAGQAESCYQLLKQQA